MNEEKAVTIGKRHSKECVICMLLDTEADKDTKFLLYKEGYFNAEDKYVCSKCVEGIKDIRKKCHQKVENPQNDVFKDWIPWFAKEVPGLVNAFKKQLI